MTKTRHEGTDDNEYKLMAHSGYGMFCAVFHEPSLRYAMYSYLYVTAHCHSRPLLLPVPPTPII